LGIQVGRVFRPAALAKIVVFIAALVPQAMLVRGALTGTLGVNPAETIQLETGRWALKFLLLSLAVTPVRRLTGWNVLIRFRRMLGLFAFFYGFCHFMSYWSFDLNFAFSAMVGDVLKRPFIALGFAAFVLMVPLAATSTKGWIRRMGKRWAQLHRLAYLSAILAVLHFAFKVKVFSGDPVWYAVVAAVLLGARVIQFFSRRQIFT
jgi:methionine sulfoxide reductase heme-binding subunit